MRMSCKVTPVNMGTIWNSDCNLNTRVAYNVTLRCIIPYCKSLIGEIINYLYDFGFLDVGRKGKPAYFIFHNI